MASIRSYPNGAGGSSGASLATLKNVYTSGTIYYVGNAVATASDSNGGNERDYPWATLAHGVGLVSAGDTIVCLAGHAETVAANMDITLAHLNIIGEGTGSLAPKFTNGVGVATNAMWTIDAANVYMDNLYFPASSVNARERINVLGASGTSILKNLYFEVGANDNQRSLKYASTGPDYAANLTFKQVGKSSGNGLENSATPNLTVEGITIDGGSFGAFTGIYYASGAVGMRITNVLKLNGARILLGTGTAGVIQVQTASGDFPLDWTV